MDDATYVIFAPKAARNSVREQLRASGDEAVRWTERKSFRGSEFFVIGPPAQARQAHEAVMTKMAGARWRMG